MESTRTSTRKKRALGHLLATALLLGLPLHTGAFVAPSVRAPVCGRQSMVKSSRIMMSVTAAKNAQEKELLDSIEGLARREAQNSAASGARVLSAIAALEKAKGIKKPACAKEVEGRWRLLYTSSDSTASPIQRSFIGNPAFSVFQEIDLSSAEPTVTNVVDFGAFGELRVQALASTNARPLRNFTPRQGDGLILGLPIFGVSKNQPPADPDDRIDFRFVDAGFDLTVLPFRLPYPVPFRLLGDEVKGWIDTTYLSPTLRVSRGNKGTIFVLQKEAA